MNIRYALGNYIKLFTHKISFRNITSKVPLSPVITLKKDEQAIVNVNKHTVALLERLSLVKYDNVDSLKILEDSIAFANKILQFNTDHVQPLYSVLEKKNLCLRNDKITQGNCQKDILRNASVKEDDYFVAPLGNIPLHEVYVEENIAQEVK